MVKKLFSYLCSLIFFIKVTFKGYIICFTPNGFVLGKPSLCCKPMHKYTPLVCLLIKATSGLLSAKKTDQRNKCKTKK